MRTKVYIYGLCNIFYDGFYIKGLMEIYKEFEFNVSKFPKFRQGTFAVIIESQNQCRKIIIDSNDSYKINKNELEWSDIYGKVNYKDEELPLKGQEKIVPIGPSFGIKIWNLIQTLYFLSFNLIRFKKNISDKREFVANYWRQYKRSPLDKYQYEKSSRNEVFFINTIWKNEVATNKYRALFIEKCKNNKHIIFEGGFAARSNGDNLGFDSLVYSKKIPFKDYLQRIKKSAFVFSTPAVLSCHGWKLGEFLALGKAIITTPHFNKLPEKLKNKKHVMYADTEEEIEECINKLINDLDFKRKLEIESRNYYDQYLSPKKVLLKLTENNSK